MSRAHGSASFPGERLAIELDHAGTDTVATLASRIADTFDWPADDPDALAAADYAVTQGASQDVIRLEHLPPTMRRASILRAIQPPGDLGPDAFVDVLTASLIARTTLASSRVPDALVQEQRHVVLGVLRDAGLID